MKRCIALTTSVMILTSCGKESEEEPEKTKTVNYATLVVDATTDQQDTTYTLTSVDTCTNNPDSGLFTASFSSGNNTQLEVAIKGFSTAGKTYTCTQAEGNEEGDIGQKFDSCKISLKIPSAPEATTYDVYDMHRTASNQGEFTYTGTCTIQISYEDPKVSGTLTCGSLIQTILESSARNPISEEVTADIASTSSFFCNL